MHPSPPIEGLRQEQERLPAPPADSPALPEEQERLPVLSEGAPDPQAGQDRHPVPPPEEQEGLPAPLEGALDISPVQAGATHRRELALRQGFSEQAAKLVANSIRTSSGINYEYKVRIYMQWCEKQLPPVDPFTCPPHAVCNFLAEILHSRDIGQSSVAGYRSAISKVHSGWDGVAVGANPLVSALVKGTRNMFPHRRARKPRYEVTWDITKVLDALAPLHPPEALSLPDLAMKTLALVALSSVSRVSSLVSLSRAWDRQVNPTEPGENQFRVFFLPESLEKHDKGRIGLFIPPPNRGSRTGSYPLRTGVHSPHRRLASHRPGPSRHAALGIHEETPREGHFYHSGKLVPKGHAERGHRHEHL